MQTSFSPTPVCSENACTSTPKCNQNISKKCKHRSRIVLVQRKRSIDKTQVLQVNRTQGKHYSLEGLFESLPNCSSNFDATRHKKDPIVIATGVKKTTPKTRITHATGHKARRISVHPCTKSIIPGELNQVKSVFLHVQIVSLVFVCV